MPFYKFLTILSNFFGGISFFAMLITTLGLYFVDIEVLEQQFARAEVLSRLGTVEILNEKPLHVGVRVF